MKCAIFFLWITILEFFYNKNVIILFKDWFLIKKKTFYVPCGDKKRVDVKLVYLSQFWRYDSADTFKIKDFLGKFDGTILKMRQQLADTHMAQNQKWQKNFCSFLYPQAFPLNFAIFRVKNWFLTCISEFVCSFLSFWAI